MPAHPATNAPCPVSPALRIDATNGPWPLHDAARSRAIEACAQALAPQPPLMARAGLALAQLGRALAPHARRTLVLAGPGNNGGDGLVAARWLHTARHPVLVRLAADPVRLPPDAAQALRMAVAAGVQVQAFDAGEDLALGQDDLLIDALLGIGTRRAPEGPVAQAIAATRRCHAFTLAVDLPSGLHPDTGALLRHEAVRAQATLALLTLKPGCFTAQGRDHAGQLWWHGLGVEARAPGATAWLAGPPPAWERPHAGHKGRFGDVWVLGGAAGMTGALALAAHAALAAGAGRVYAGLLEAAHAPALRAEIMLRALEEAQQATVLAGATVVAGCGGGQAIAAALPKLITHAARLVLDADALNAVASCPALQQALQQRAGGGLASVLTPHPLEAARLLGISLAAVQADRLAAAVKLAHQFQAVVVLKGSGTVLAAPGRDVLINPTGNAALGSAGTGDVLAGWLGGNWAQLDTAVAAPDDAAWQAAQAAVWRHGQAADLWLRSRHDGPLRAANLIEAMLSLPLPGHGRGAPGT